MLNWSGCKSAFVDAAIFIWYIFVWLTVWLHSHSREMLQLWDQIASMPLTYEYFKWYKMYFIDWKCVCQRLFCYNILFQVKMVAFKAFHSPVCIANRFLYLLFCFVLVCIKCGERWDFGFMCNGITQVFRVVGIGLIIFLIISHWCGFSSAIPHFT